MLEAARSRAPGAVYSPVDVSDEALASASARMRTCWPALEVRAYHGDYVDGLTQAADGSGDTPLLALLLGSNIGNLEWKNAVGGFDLLKSEEVLRAAYDDAEGVTAAFNLNLLRRINRELGGDFDLGAFEHRATFDPTRPAMESWLVSLRGQAVTLADRRFEFRQGERVHTEISWKYRESQISELAREAGFQEVEQFLDERRWFGDALWRVEWGTR